MIPASSLEIELFNLNDSKFVNIRAFRFFFFYIVFSSWTFCFTGSLKHWKDGSLKQTHLILRLEAVREPGLFRGRAASLMCFANWKIIPNPNTYCVKHRAVCGRVPRAFVSFWCVCAQNQIFSSFTSKVTKNNFNSTNVPKDLTSLLCHAAKSGLWGCLVSCLRKTHRGWFTSMRLFPKKTIHTLK